MAEPGLEQEAPLPRQLWRWWRLRSRRGLLITGSLPNTASVDFVARLRAGTVLPLPLDAERPEDADVVLIVGRIALKMTPSLARLRERLPPGALVASFDAPASPFYAGAPATDILAVDLVVEGLPPPPAAVDALIRRLLPRRPADGGTS